MRSRVILSLLLLLVLVIILPCTLLGQDSRHLTFLRSVPQSYRINPANEVPYGWWMGFPGLSSWSVGVENSGFTYKDVLYRTPDDTLHFDVEGFLGALRKSNYLSADLQAEVLAFGFHASDLYVDFRFTDRLVTNFNYTRDLMSFLLKLNGQFINETAEFSGTGVNMNCFHELSLGFSKDVKEKFRLGARVKLLSGIANISSKKTEISLYTDEELAYSLTAHSDIEINTSIPGLDNERIEDSLSFHLDEGKAWKALTEIRNPGIALDLGIQYQLDDRFQFGFSVVDLGFIHWKYNPRNYVSDKNKHSFTFEGIDISDLFENDSTIFKDQIQLVLDSLSSNLGINTTHETYTAFLVTQLNLTAQFSPNDRNHFGVLIRGDVFNKQVMPTFLINYNLEVAKIFNIMAGYHLNLNNYLNLALGYSLKLAGIELYMITDNAYAFFDPLRSKLAHFQFGINFCFTDKRLRP